MRLLDAGFPQSTVFEWMWDQFDRPRFGADKMRGYVRESGSVRRDMTVVCAAPTLSEILSELPEQIQWDEADAWLRCDRDGEAYTVFYGDNEHWSAVHHSVCVFNTNAAEAAAQLYVSLHAVGLIEKIKRTLETDAQPTLPAACDDCNRPYDEENGFPDLIVPDDVWLAISPNGDFSGLLCPSCICGRVHKAGLGRVEARFQSGPFAVHRDHQFTPRPGDTRAPRRTRADLTPETRQAA